MNLWKELDEWPNGPDGNPDLVGLANFSSAKIKELQPEMLALGERLHEQFDELEEATLKLLEHDLPPDHPLIRACVFTLGILNLHAAEYGLQAALREMNAKPPSEWIAPKSED